MKLSFDQPITTAEITGLGAVNMLEAIRIVDPKITLLPGIDLRDVWQGGVRSAGRKHQVLSPQPLWRGQAIRPLDDHQLS